MSIDAYTLVTDWIRVERGCLLLRTGKVDLGQRISTALVRIATEELSVPVANIDVAAVRTDRSPDEGITSGSNSIEQSGAAQRLACATAREWVMARAAEQLEAQTDALVLEDGNITHRATNKKIAVLDLLSELPADLAIDPAAPARDLSAPLADMLPRGLDAMVTGRFVYVHDLEMPGMLHARIVCPPKTDAVLKEVDQDVISRLSQKGMSVVRDGSFLAVAGPDEWSVVRAATALGNACDWDIGAGLPTGDIFDIMAGKEAQRFAVIDGKPDPAVDVPMQLDAPAYAEVFERPYTLHGALGPSAALATFSGGKLEILTHSQGIYFLRDSIADSLGMAPEHVVLEHVPGSGCYGHNAADDAAFEAALVAKAHPDTPILLKYSRTDEHGREPVSTAMAVRVEAHKNEAGDISHLWMETRGDTHRGRPRAGANRAGPARLAANAARDCDVPRFVPEPNMNRHAGLHRNLDPIYRFSEKRLVKALVPDLPLRPSALRCLGAPANVLAIESMMDECACAAGQDPIAYRLRHLDDPRASAVLGKLSDILKAADPCPDGIGRGIAYAQYKNAMTRVAVAVDLAVADTGAVLLNHVRLVADAGRVVDPDGLAAQLEGGVLQGASWALYEQVVWGRDGRESLDWDSYPVLRFDNVPTIDVTIIGSEHERSVGAGEASPGPTVAAIANGVYAATGLRLRRLPFDADAVLTAALQA